MAAAYERKLEESSNLLDLYMHAAGHSEIPKEWHRWTCLVLVAAAVGDRVFYRKFEWEKMAPNMYVFLVGPSGCGKGGAIGFGQQFIHPRMNAYTGSLTSKGMVDMMCGASEDGGTPKSKMWVIQPELADCIGSGLLANSMVKAMTNWYNPSSQELQETTRAHGRKSFEPPCINWLAGTTVEWLKQTVDTEAMLSGFFGRVAIAPGIPDYSVRVYEPTSPPDYVEVVKYIKDELLWMTNLKGEFTLSAGARAQDKEWYDSRPAAKMPELEPFWKRQHDLNLKVAMLLSLCESLDLRVAEEHMLMAQTMTDQSAKMLPEVIHAATASPATQRSSHVQKVIEHYKKIKHSVLLRKVAHWHINAHELRAIIQYLEDLGSVRTSKSGAGGRVYHWEGVRQVRMPRG